MSDRGGQCESVVGGRGRGAENVTVKKKECLGSEG